MDLDAATVAMRQALEQRRLRVHVKTALPGGLTQERVLAAAWTAVRARHVAPGNSQDELLELETVTPENGGFLVRLRYVFDADFASQYDATESHALELWLDQTRWEVRRYAPLPG